MIRFITLLIVLGYFTSNPLIAANDGQSIYINCPSDKWLYCDKFDGDLSSYGSPTVTSAHAYDIEELDAEYSLNNCNIGHINRHWKIIDHFDHKNYYCHQRIKIKAKSTAISIDWPDDYVIYECDPDLDPHNLPDRFGYPDIDESGGCSDIYTGYKDFILYNDGAVCFKVLREWTVIDWCQYEPNTGGSAGKWIYEQFLKVKSEDIPDIYCPNDTVVSVDSDCEGAHVYLAEATGSGQCEGELKITNDSPYAIEGGANASGYYPLGDTWVKFTADDRCGNKSTCKVKITVKDNYGPTVFCKYGISVPLASMSDGYYTDLWPMEFNEKSYDNCTDDNDLIFEISLNRVTCENLGQNDVYLTVTDEQGNSTTCRSFVIVQDNKNLCAGSNAPYSLDGNVTSQDLAPIQGVQIAINDDMSNAIMSNASGQYNYTGLDHEFDYMVKPIKDNNISDGLSSFDLISLIWHIIGKSEITDPYKLVSADVDNSGEIDIYDFYSLRNVVLGLANSFPNNTSWRFNLSSNDLSDLENPLAQIVESYLLESVNEDMHELNFTGIKVGDVDGSVTTNRNVYGRSDNTELTLLSSLIEKDELISVPIIENREKSFEGLIDISVEYDPTLLEFVSVENHRENDLIDKKIFFPENGIIGLISYGVFSSAHLVFKAKKSQYIAEGLATQNIGHFISEDGQLTNLNLNVDRNLASDLKLEIHPNPFSNYLEIKFISETDSPAELKFFNSLGKEILATAMLASKGYNVFSVNASSIKDNGILMYKLINNKIMATGQIIKME